VTRTGLPGTTTYSMADHPVQEISWYGAAVYCNWLSEMHGLAPVYDTGTWDANFANDGYHLPTEAQWERAAAWDGAKHWIYGFTSDTLTGKNRCNYQDENPDHVNPLGLTYPTPYTSPAGWFDGVNVSPNGTIATVDSSSPIGCYDMSGNVYEWCHDAHGNDYYTNGGPPWIDPAGPVFTSTRAVRGSGFGTFASNGHCRTASRGPEYPTTANASFGFRIARQTAMTPQVVSFVLDDDAATTGSWTVSLDSASLGYPSEYLASEDPAFAGAEWQAYAASPSFALSAGNGTKTVYFKVRNAAGESPPASDAIERTDMVSPEMIPVPAGTFEMGDPWGEGLSTEEPVHDVTLSAYEIGKYEVTNQQICDVYNWADDQGYFTTVNGNTAQAYGEELLDMDSSYCQITYSGGVFSPETRDTYAMADHPVSDLSWFGAAVYCNWLSEITGLTPVYDTSDWSWDLSNDGYHLPTEAQWERAAAWDAGASRHYRYGNGSDSIACDSANHGPSSACNPLGLSGFPYTSPAGYYDGTNGTVDSPSPVGCYDMSGNVWEWCNDWWHRVYTASPVTDPEGPGTGSNRVGRGGGWYNDGYNCRSALRGSSHPSYAHYHIGFRLAR